MTHLTNHLQSTIKREVARLYKASFGKGPENTDVVIYQNFIFIKINGAFCQIEESLMHSAIGKELVEKIRDELILSRTAGYIPAVEKIVKEKVEKINYMMEEEKNNLYIFLMFANDIKVV